MAKQRMAGYTRLRQRNQVGSSPELPAYPSQDLGLAVEPTQAPAPVVLLERDQPPTPEPESLARFAAPTHSKQRMKGYVPLRLRHETKSVESSTVAAPLTQREASPFTPAPGPIPAEQKPTVEASGMPGEMESEPIPKNRMKGYTPLRQRAGSPVDQALLSPVAAQSPVEMSLTSASSARSSPSGDNVEVAITSQLEHPTDEKKHPQWVRPLLAVTSIAFVALIIILSARGLRTLEPVQNFIATYDGHSTMPDSAPAGMPWWMGWQHSLNMFFMVLVIRTGLQIRHEKRPPAAFTPQAGSFFSPNQNTPKKMSITTWMHQSLDVLWIANGLIFVVLLAMTGHWMRIVPTSLDIFPNMASAALQYASMDWPLENGWIHYNALQMVSYFLIIYVVAPLAVLTGLRMSSWWPQKTDRLNKIYPIEIARKLHFPVMIAFILFVIVHVFLVFATSSLRNLNHMYTSRDVVDFWGLVIFLGSVTVTAVAWFLVRPAFVVPLASKLGKVTKN